MGKIYNEESGIYSKIVNEQGRIFLQKDIISRGFYREENVQWPALRTSLHLQAGIFFAMWRGEEGYQENAGSSLRFARLNTDICL